MSKAIDKHLHKIGYVIAIALPASLIGAYFIEFELNRPIEFPITEKIEIGEMRMSYILYNNVRDKGVANGDELVFFSKYIRDPEKYRPSSVIYLEVGELELFEKKA